MTVVLYRVDERLIHGQVVVGWGLELRPDRYVVVDDALAGSEWEQELYRIALPDGASAAFLDVDEARSRLAEMREDEDRTVLLTRDVQTMLRLAEGGALRDEEVNLGGLHAAEGRSAVRPYLHVDDADRARIRELAEEGVEVSARDLPGAPRVDVSTLLSA